MALDPSTETYLPATAVGSNGQVLTVVNGVPAWSSPASFGMTLLSTTTLSGLITTIPGIDQNYKNLMVETIGITGGNTVAVNPNGATLFNGYRLASTIVAMANTTLNSGDTYANGGDTTGNKSTMWIFDYANTSSYKNLELLENFYNVGGSYVAYKYLGMIKTNSAITSLVYTASAGGFASGTVKIWGVK